MRMRSRRPSTTRPFASETVTRNSAHRGRTGPPARSTRSDASRATSGTAVRVSATLVVCLVGGVGSKWGPLIGAAILVPLSEGTRVYLGGTGKAMDLVVYGALVMLVSVLQPGGVMALAQRGRRRTG